MAESVVHGAEEQFQDQIEFVHLNLLSPIGRQAAGQYGIRIVPVTLLFDGTGKLVERQAGIPDAQWLSGRIRQVAS